MFAGNQQTQSTFRQPPQANEANQYQDPLNTLNQTPQPLSMGFNNTNTDQTQNYDDYSIESSFFKLNSMSKRNHKYTIRSFAEYAAFKQFNFTANSEMPSFYPAIAKRENFSGGNPNSKYYLKLGVDWAKFPDAKVYPRFHPFESSEEVKGWGNQKNNIINSKPYAGFYSGSLEYQKFKVMMYKESVN